MSHFRKLRSSQESERQTRKGGIQKPGEESFRKKLVVNRVQFRKTKY